MRIDINDKIHAYKSVAMRQDIKMEKQNMQTTNNSKYDQIEIRGSNSQKERLFFDKMVKRIQENVMNQSKEEKINQLKEKVENGTFTFNVTEIVSKILIEKGE